MVDESYERKAWHGPNLRGSIRGLDVRRVSWRPAAGRHNIWEIVVHAAYWKYIVRRRLVGDKKGSFPLRGSNWFVRSATMTAEAWRSDLALLEDMHRKMRAAIAGLKPADLPDSCPQHRQQRGHYYWDRLARCVPCRPDPAVEAAGRVGDGALIFRK
jgi:hypothetical protein